MFLILDSGFEYMNVLSCVYNDYNTYTGFQYSNKKLNKGQLFWPAAFMLINKVSDGACQWIFHDVVISIGRIIL